MNLLHRDCFLFAATATMLAGCCTPSVITETDTDTDNVIRKTIKGDGRGGIVEDNQNLELVKPSDGFTVIGAPHAVPINGAQGSPTPAPKPVSTHAQWRKMHIKYNNAILVALGAEANAAKSTAVQTNNQKAGHLWYRVWVPSGDPDNIGRWSKWTRSDDQNGPDTDSPSPSLSGTVLERGKWHLLPQQQGQDKMVKIEATAKDSNGNPKQYTWTGCWSPLTKNGKPDPNGRGSITWHLGSSPCQ